MFGVLCVWGWGHLQLRMPGGFAKNVEKKERKKHPATFPKILHAFLIWFGFAALNRNPNAFPTLQIELETLYWSAHKQVFFFFSFILCLQTFFRSFQSSHVTTLGPLLLCSLLVLPQWDKACLWCYGVSTILGIIVLCKIIHLCRDGSLTNRKRVEQSWALINQEEDWHWVEWPWVVFKREEDWHWVEWPWALFNPEEV